MHELLVRKEQLRKLQRALEDQVRFLNEEIDTHNAQVKAFQSGCNHVQEWYGEGRHGSEKGTKYYKCKICDFHWDDG